MIHPQSSVWRALQPRSSSQPSPASSGAPGGGCVFRSPDGGWGHEKGFVQPASGSGASQEQQESTGSWGGAVDLGWWVQPLVSPGAKSTTPTSWDSAAVLFLTAAMLSKSKSEGELWLHPYLWQSHVLSLTPPREAWHHCLPVQLEGLSLTGCAPRGCYVGASPMPEHQAKAAGLERDHPAPSEGVCRQDQRPQEGHLTRGLWQVTASKCSRWPAQAVKHRLPSPGVSQSAWQCRAWDEGWDVLCPQPSHHGKRLARAGADNSPNQRCCNSTGTSMGCCCHNRASP